MYLLLRILQNIHGYLQLGDSDRGAKARTCENDVEPLSIRYSLVPIRRHGSINRHTSFIWPFTFPKIWGVTINWINTQFWSTSRGTFDKNNLAPIAYTFVGVSINWIVTFSMPWGMTINWIMSSNWHQRVMNRHLQSHEPTTGNQQNGLPAGGHL